MTLLAIIALCAVTLMGISHLIALRTEKPRPLAPHLASEPPRIHRPRLL